MRQCQEASMLAATHNMLARGELRRAFQMDGFVDCEGHLYLNARSHHALVACCPLGDFGVSI